MSPERTLNPRTSHLRVEKHNRHWKVMDGDTLVAIVLYKKGADEVKRRLERSNPCQT